MAKIILVVLVIAAVLTECIMMRKSREYDAADYKEIKVEADK